MTTTDKYRLHLRLRAFAPNAHRVVLDSEYALLDTKAPGKLHSEWISAAWSRDLIAWQPERADCDDWAWLFRAWCLHRHIISTGRPTALAVGYLHYTPDNGAYHAIAVAVTSPAASEIVFQPIEPQPHGGPLDLSDSERNSIDLLII